MSGLGGDKLAEGNFPGSLQAFGSIQCTLATGGPFPLKRYRIRALGKWHSLCSLRKQITEPRALAALRFPCQIRLSRLAPAAHFEQSECHWALDTGDGGGPLLP
jgi:hypothetical protein